MVMMMCWTPTLPLTTKTSFLPHNQVWQPGCSLKACQMRRKKRRRKLTTYSLLRRNPKEPNQSYLQPLNTSGRRRTSTPLLCLLSTTPLPLSISKTCSTVGGDCVLDEPLCMTGRHQHFLPCRHA